MVFADERDIYLLPKVGCAWMPKGTELEVMTRDSMRSTTWRGHWILETGTLHHGVGPRETKALFRDLPPC